MIGSNICTYSVEMARKYGLNASILYTEIFQRVKCPEPNREPDVEGYIPITADEFQCWTTLTRRQQDKALSVLEDNGLIKCVVKGLPAKKHFKILEGQHD